ncbi:MAG: hypothetical protein R2813_02980 [Flavobacteriales bacterium]
MKVYLKGILATLALSLTLMVSDSFAPPPDPGSAVGGGGSASCWPPPCVPIDGGVVLLAIAGAAIGLKRFI